MNDAGMNKPRLYFLPGTMCDETLWHRLWPLLQEDFELVHLAIPQEASLVDMARALNTELGKIHCVQPINLVGFSLGGYLAALYTSLYPASVERLLVMANSPCALPESELKPRRQIIAWLQHSIYKGATDARIQLLLGSKSQSDLALIRHIQQMERNLGLEQLLPQLSASSVREDLTSFFARTQIPTRFIYGKQDVLVDSSWFSGFTNPNVRAKDLGDYGHMLPLEAPELVGQQIRRHFNISQQFP